MENTVVAPESLHNLQDGGAERNLGIDALRLFSMLLIVVHHVLGHGGVLSGTCGIKHEAFVILNVLAYCAVDCYAIVSGYVGVRSRSGRYHVAGYLKLWVSVVFYGVGILLGYYLLRPDQFAWLPLVRAVFPVASIQYWYFSAYTGLFLVRPWLNRFFSTNDQRSTTKLLLVLVGGFSVFSLCAEAAFSADPFFLGTGYSALWLMILYCLGAWLRQCRIPEKLSSRRAWLIIVCCYGVILVGVFILDFFSGSVIVFINPLYALIAAMYVVIFSKLKLSGWSEKLVRCFAPAAFGVYLIHDNPNIREKFISGSFQMVSALPSIQMFAAVLGIVLGVFIVCLCVEKLRLIIFKRIGIDKLIERIAQAIEGASRRCFVFLYSKLD